MPAGECLAEQRGQFTRLHCAELVERPATTPAELSSRPRKALGRETPAQRLSRPVITTP
ncbi:hypothetical protein OG936_03890 [Streptomyces sp. NBC_00846]|uniref:hypothetical protein n=1 Tax=Streptomyces sp. NBC_00846 TaxID=2975849 RepID=UPI00386B8138|nr:hypothetical protein OG936_03890 [Streptomyces sp. NBC_00846]